MSSLKQTMTLNADSEGIDKTRIAQAYVAISRKPKAVMPPMTTKWLAAKRLPATGDMIHVSPKLMTMAIPGALFIKDNVLNIMFFLCRENVEPRADAFKRHRRPRVRHACAGVSYVCRMRGTRGYRLLPEKVRRRTSRDLPATKNGSRCSHGTLGRFRARS